MNADSSHLMPGHFVTGAGVPGPATRVTKTKTLVNVAGVYSVSLTGTAPVPAVGQSVYGPGVAYGAKVEAGTSQDTLVMTMPTFDEIPAGTTLTFGTTVEAYTAKAGATVAKLVLSSAITKSLSSTVLTLVSRQLTVPDTAGFATVGTTSAAPTTKGSTDLTMAPAVTVTAGMFVSGPGIAPGTRVAVDSDTPGAAAGVTAGTTVTLDRATASKMPAASKILFRESLSVGGNGIPAGAAVTGISGAASFTRATDSAAPSAAPQGSTTIKISAAAAPVTATTTGTPTAADETDVAVTSVTVTAGMLVSGPGIAPGTRVVADQTAATTINLDTATTSIMQAGTTLTFTTPAITVGMGVSGTGIAAGTSVTQVTGETLTLSKVTSGSVGTSTSLTFVGSAVTLSEKLTASAAGAIAFDPLTRDLALVGVTLVEAKPTAAVATTVKDITLDTSTVGVHSQIRKGMTVTGGSHAETTGTAWTVVGSTTITMTTGITEAITPGQYLRGYGIAEGTRVNAWSSPTLTLEPGYGTTATLPPGSTITFETLKPGTTVDVAPGMPNGAIYNGAAVVTLSEGLLGTLSTTIATGDPLKVRQRSERGERPRIHHCERSRDRAFRSRSSGGGGCIPHRAPCKCQSP